MRAEVRFGSAADLDTSLRLRQLRIGQQTSECGSRASASGQKQTSTNVTLGSEIGARRSSRVTDVSPEAGMQRVLRIA